MDERAQERYWLNKKAKIEILKDGHRLIFTAIIINEDDSSLTFRDRDNKVFFFNKDSIIEMVELGGSPYGF